MTEYKKDPKLALAALEKIAEEIPSGVSVEDVCEIFTKLGASPEELVANIGKGTVTGVNSELENFWSKLDVSRKLEDVGKLEKVESGNVARGSHNLLNLTNATSLQLQIEMLKLKRKKLKKQNSRLKNELAKYTPSEITKKLQV